MDLKELRRHLHKHPELSGNESKTAEFIRQSIRQYNPDKIISGIGGHGLAVIFDFTGNHRSDQRAEYPTVMFRAELDALPIAETNNFSYRSSFQNISHKCGHDGHMAILIGLADMISRTKPKLKIILLFQPAEEIAAGAKLVIQDHEFMKLKPDYIFALHNLPRYEKGSVLIRKGIFSSTSIGMIVTLKGETSHAGHPENGNNPTSAMIEIIRRLMAIPEQFSEFALLTVIYAKLGEIAFGTSPGEAVIMATLRAHEKNTLESMQTMAENLTEKAATAQNLAFNIEWVEYFPEIINNNEAVNIVEKAALNLNKKIIKPEQPFAWTEDFSWFTQQIKGAFFGLGAGIEHPQLHNADYDFPDEISRTGSEIFFEIIREICKREKI
ncbi:MAG: amidohydrolase [Candidatus Cloacimonetes bacterium]|nr:amidohydrolase [Candidatus Cloacimonadota bacterium]